MENTSFWIFLSAMASFYPIRTNEQVTSLSEFNRCAWHIGLTSATSPYSVTKAYFNEKGPFEIKDLLKEPDVNNYVSMVTIGEGRGHFSYPYFILVRGVCDTGFYDDNYYRIIMYGAFPGLTMEYTPETLRDKHRGSLKVSTVGALVDLLPDTNFANIPRNHHAPNCYFNLCYPGFLIPQIFLNIPIFDITVGAMDEFKQGTKRIYVSPYTSRKTGSTLEISPNTPDPEPMEFFPPERISTIHDPEHLRASIITDLKDPDHFPLDKEDFIEPHYTQGASPAVFFAGFYDPNLMIMTDPDLNEIQRFRWTLNPLKGKQFDEKSTIFDHGLTCTFDKSYQQRDQTYPVPLFTRGEGPNSYSWLGTFYRKRFKPLQYLKSPVPMAIFDVVSLEERLLLVTNSGLVTFYGETNTTVATGRAFRAGESEKIRKCFKLVRATKFANQKADMVVGVTYRYNELKTTHMGHPSSTTQDIESTVQTIDQEIWIGRLEERGNPMKWERLGESKVLEESEEHTPISQSETICEQAMNEKFSDDKNNTNLLECWIQDATPGIDAQSVQVLIEIQLQHIPTFNAYADALQNNESANYLNLVRGEDLVTFYIIAQHSPSNAYRKNQWEIISLVPRRPCINPHRQAVENIENYEPGSYFFNNETDKDYDNIVERFEDSCHIANRDKMKDDLHLYRMTYTRQPNGHLFLYGNRLIHSTDGGDAFAYMRSFPHEDEMRELVLKNKEFIKASKVSTRQRRYAELNRMIISHVIKLMAFSSSGTYAFLTSKRHLYWGSIGSVSQIRLRPSPGYSMIRTMLSHRPGIHDGRSFSILFDSFDNLHELIAVVNSNSSVVAISKRTIPWDMIIRNNNFVTKLYREASKPPPESDFQHQDSNSSLSNNSTTSAEENFDEDNIFRVGIAKFKDFCPYGDNIIDQNYSIRYDRKQHFSVLPPKQHISLGLVSGKTLLMAFQAIMFSLIHMTYYQPPQNDYSHQEGDDPFTRWRYQTGVQSRISEFKYMVGDPKSHGIIFESAGSKSISTTAAINKKNMWLRRLYLDYNEKIQIILEFSVKTQASIDKTNYRTQRLSALQITVDNANGSLLEVETERIQNAKSAGARFKILLALNKKVGSQPGASLPQSGPGEYALIIPISFHFLGGFQYCTPTRDGSYVGDSLHTAVYAGCIPNRELKLNWNLTLRSLKFRNPRAWMGSQQDCYDDEPACFHSQIPLVLHFDLFDTVLHDYTTFQGKYTLRVIGGGYSRTSISDYTEDEQKAYNIPGTSDFSLIWTEWNIKYNRKVRVKPLNADMEHLDVPDTVLNSGKSAIKWSCNILSPCSRITPSWSFQTIYYFKIRISNRDVDRETLCLYERDIVIQLYGFSPSPEIQLLISALACFLILLLMYLFYVCNRNEKRVWKANQVKIYGWIQIILDTFPKPQTIKAQKKELQLQLKKDEILLSLRGYLGVPSKLRPAEPIKYRKPTDQDETSTSLDRLSRALSRRREDDEGGSSDEFIYEDETESEQDNEKPIAKVVPRRPPATWTDMVYNQLILKRATAIEEGEHNDERVSFAQVSNDEIINEHPQEDRKKKVPE